MTDVMASDVKVAVVKIAKMFVTREQECVQIAKVVGRETIAVKVRFISIRLFCLCYHDTGITTLKNVTYVSTPGI